MIQLASQREDLILRPFRSTARAGIAFTPASLGTSVINWYSADSLALADGAAVSSWTDLSSFGRHAVQATGANQPVFKTNIMNGKPVIRFDGSNDILVASTAYPAAVSYFIVVKFASLANAYTSLYDSSQNSGTTHGSTTFLIKSSGRSALYANYSSGQQAYDGTGAGLYTLATPYIFAGVFQTNGLTSWTNGTLDKDITFTGTLLQNVTGANISIGAASFFSSRVLNGDMAEFILCDRVLTTAERASMHNYLSVKYGIIVA